MGKQIAKEIFESIENNAHIALINGHIDNACICIDYEFYKELKKKYEVIDNEQR